MLLNEESWLTYTAWQPQKHNIFFNVVKEFSKCYIQNDIALLKSILAISMIFKLHFLMKCQIP